MGWVRKPIDKRVINEARRLRATKELAHIDYARALVEATKVMNQTQVAEQLGITQPAISQVLRTPPEIVMPREGFSGADPRETIKRYVAGHLTKPATIRELAAWGEQEDYTYSDIEDQIHQAVEVHLISEEIGNQMIERITQVHNQ